jgi:hypothetical protein
MNVTRLADGSFALREPSNKVLEDNVESDLALTQ